MGFLLYKTFLMVSGHLFLLHKISTIQCQDTIRCSSTVTDSFYIYIFYTKYWKYVLFFLFGSLRLVLSNFFPMCFLALALETGKQLMQAWCHWNKAEVMNEHLEHLGTSQKILGRHRTSENVWELGTHGNVLKKRCVNRPLLWKHQATWAWLIWVPKTIQVHFIAFYRNIERMPAQRSPPTALRSVRTSQTASWIPQTSFWRKKAPDEHKFYTS